MPEPGTTNPMKGKIGGIPKPVAIGGVVVAILLGLYLRSRSQASQASAQAAPAAQDTSTGYVPPADQSSGLASSYVDPYGTLSGNGFDATSFNEGISYAQGGFGTTVSGDGTGTTAAPSPTPSTIQILTGPVAGRTSGKPNQSARKPPKPPVKSKTNNKPTASKKGAKKYVAGK